jgi:hypothetical protein
MASRPELALLGFVPVLAGFVACGQTATLGDIRTFALYDVQVDATDQPDLNTGDPQRQLLFNFNGINNASLSQCATFGDATATFSGQPVAIPSPGGWVVNNIPTNTAPGQTINGDHCYDPFIEILFNNPQGEPQDGTLDIDGDGAPLEVPYNHPFGSPSITLVSATSTLIILSLQNFLVTPTLADVAVTLTEPLNSYSVIAIQQTMLTPDGMLELSLSAGTVTNAVEAPLLVSVNLGDDVLQCVGFKSCSATSFFTRSFEVDIPFP